MNVCFCINEKDHCKPHERETAQIFVIFPCKLYAALKLETVWTNGNTNLLSKSGLRQRMSVNAL